MTQTHACIAGLFLVGLLLVAVRLRVFDGVAVAGLILSISSVIAAMIADSVIPSRRRRKRLTAETAALKPGEPPKRPGEPPSDVGGGSTPIP